MCLCVLVQLKSCHPALCAHMSEQNTTREGQHTHTHMGSWIVYHLLVKRSSGLYYYSKTVDFNPICDTNRTFFLEGSNKNKDLPYGINICAKQNNYNKKTNQLKKDKHTVFTQVIILVQPGCTSATIQLRISDNCCRLNTRT